VKWAGSDVLDLESSRNPDTDRRKKVEALLGAATSKVTVGSRERERGKVLETLGFGAFRRVTYCLRRERRRRGVLDDG
jgi:hypothetical protein